MPASLEMDLPMAKAGLIICNGGTSGITEKSGEKKKKKPCTIAAREHMGENILRETVLQILRSLKREW